MKLNFFPPFDVPPKATAQLQITGENYKVLIVGSDGVIIGRKEGIVSVALPEVISDVISCLGKCTAVMDSLRDFVAEGGSSRMIGAREAVDEADKLLQSASDLIRRAKAVPQGKFPIRESGS